MVSKDFFAEGGEGQLHGQIGRAVVLVNHRIHLDNFEAQHAGVVGDNFHGQVAFAVGGAAAHGSAYAGRVLGINPVHVERNMVAGSAAAGHAQRFFHHYPHAALVNVTHGEDFHAGLADVFFFETVNVTHAHDDAIFRQHLGGKAENIRQFRRSQSHDGGQGHAVDVAAGRCSGGVDVTVSVNPDQSDLLLLAAVKLGDA